MRVAVVVVVGPESGEGGRWIVRGKNGMVEVPVGTRFSSLLGSAMWIGAEGLLDGDKGVGGGASK